MAGDTIPSVTGQDPRTSADRAGSGNVRAQLDDALAHLSDGLVLFDPQWRLVYANERARSISRIQPEHINGPTHWELYPSTVGTEVEVRYRQTMEERVAGEFDFFYEPFQVWLKVRVFPAGEGVAIQYSDVTALHEMTAERLEEERAETERQRSELEAVYDAAPIGLALFDPTEFRYLRVNRQQAEVLGRPVSDLLGRRIDEVISSPEVVQLFQKVRNGETVRNHTYETQLKGRPGEVRSFHVNYSPVYSESGEVCAISAAVLEVTMQQKAEKALIQSEKLAAVGRLASSISHEINNPLEAVTNLLYLAERDEGLTDGGRSYVRLAQDELTRMSQIATQTLRFHRQSNSPIRVTAAQLVDPVLNLYHGRLLNSGIHVEASYATARKVLCFENDIRQVLNNLIANAIDAMRNGGRLIVRAHNQCDLRSDAEGVRITVADTGHGMDEATIRRVFEPFYTTKEMNGNGLGLWISQGIVERHQGQLRVHSTQHPQRHGTVFSLFLPSSEHPQPAQ